VAVKSTDTRFTVTSARFSASAKVGSHRRGTAARSALRSARNESHSTRPSACVIPGSNGSTMAERPDSPIDFGTYALSSNQK